MSPRQAKTARRREREATVCDLALQRIYDCWLRASSSVPSAPAVGAAMPAVL